MALYTAALGDHEALEIEMDAITGGNPYAALAVSRRVIRTLAFGGASLIAAMTADLGCSAESFLQEWGRALAAKR